MNKPLNVKPPTSAEQNSQNFIRFALSTGVLKFGEFKTKAGRLSPYFFNAGLFNDGASLGQLAGFYAERILAAQQSSELEFDVLFGPAYKGITLASASAVALHARGRHTPFAFNRKEAKDHGEGGTVVGAKLEGRVLIIDDVISAGTSVRESVELIRAHGAIPAAVIIALDRQERGGDAVNPSALSATQEVAKLYGIPVLSIANLNDLLHYLKSQTSEELSAYSAKVADYRTQWGV
jgi:orotate phosphoribosyltransferase